MANPPASVLRPFLLILSLVLLLVFSCRKHDEISTDPALMLSFSADSVIFDTVFSSIGTVTIPLKVYNKHNKGVKIASISLLGGGQSAFRINVDGTPGIEFYDKEIAPKDSIFIFVRATIDPRDASNPFVVEDDLQFITNGNRQQVKLVAWGQDAVYILADSEISGFPPFKIIADSTETIVWTNEKPYVVYGYAVVNSYGELIIEEGARIHFHDKSGLWAFSDGVLKVKGTQENPVVFQGDRLDQAYRHIPGQWDRIWLMEGRKGFDHEIDYAIIRNGFIGLQVESFLRPTENKLIIRNTIIENHTGLGLFSRLAHIEAENLVVANTGNYALALTAGGVYDFTHTTIANNWSASVRNNPALYLNNYLLDSLDQPVAIPFSLNMGNSIVYGSNAEEIDIEMIEGADTTYLFDHCLLKTTKKLENWNGFVNSIANENPVFHNYEAFNYRPDSLSPVIGKGSTEIAASVPFDLDGVSRAESVDLGAYQFVPGVEDENKSY